jgi:hypothetical protein
VVQGAHPPGLPQGKHFGLVVASWHLPNLSRAILEGLNAAPLPSALSGSQAGEFSTAHT